jgi:hypothetical protein
VKDRDTKLASRSKSGARARIKHYNRSKRRMAERTPEQEQKWKLSCTVSVSKSGIESRS